MVYFIIVINTMGTLIYQQNRHKKMYVWSLIIPTYIKKRKISKILKIKINATTTTTYSAVYTTPPKCLRKLKLIY